MEIIRSDLSTEQMESLIGKFNCAGFAVEEKMGSHGVSHLYRDGPDALAYMSGGTVGLIDESKRYSSDIIEIVKSI